MLRRTAKLLPYWGWALLGVMLVIGARYVMAAVHLPPTSPDVFGVPDPDAWLRLTLVREWLQTGHWHDHHYLSNAPFTMPISPWTRPLDVVLALLVKLQPGTPVTLALLRASAVIPFIWLLLVVAAMAKTMRAMAPQTESPMLMLGALMLTSPLMFNYFMIGNADHHSMLTALWCWVIYYGLTYDEQRWRSPLYVGSLLALMLWISPETMILIAVMYLWLGLRWLTGYASIRTLARLSSVVSLASLGALILERPVIQWFTPFYDTLSMVHVLALSLAALGFWGLVFLRPASLDKRVYAAVAIVVLAGFAMRAIDPLFFHGPLADAAPFIIQQFLPNITEAKSIAAQPLAFAIGMLIQPIVALVLCLRCARHDDSLIPQRMAALLALLIASMTLYCLYQQRWFYYLYPVTVLPLAAWLAAWMTPKNPRMNVYWPAKRLQFLSERALLCRRLPLMVTLLAAPMLLMILGNNDSSAEEKRARRCQQATRLLIQQGELNQLAGGEPLILLSSTNQGGEILFFTHHQIVASNYHREARGIEDAWNAFATDSPKEFRAILRKRRVQALLLCPDKDAPENAVATRLYTGSYHPVWATRVPLATPHLGKAAPVVMLVNDMP